MAAYGCHLRLVLALPALLACWCGCSRPEAAKAPPPPPAPWARVDNEAPQEWDAFEQWVATEIQMARDPVPLPANPVLAEPRWPFQPLEESLDRARITCTWEAADKELAPLVTVGPFRSDQQTADLRVQRSFHRKRGHELKMQIRGFSVQREDVGSISLDIRVPYGEHIDLCWSRAGLIRVPIPDNERAWKLKVVTDGLAEWEGPLDNFTIYSDGIEEGVFEIRSLSFHGHESAFPEPVGQRRVTLGHERRTVMYTYCPAQVELANCSLPATARLTVGLAAVTPERTRRPAGGQAPQVNFEIIVESDGESSTVLHKEVNTLEYWTDASVSLAAWAGKEVTLVLKTQADQPGLIGLWGSPTIYQPVKDPPLMILYLIDALSAKHIALYGYHRLTTPRIEALAEQGVWFANMFANSPVTVSSVPDTQLSMPTERHGVYRESIAAPLELITLSEALRAAGFATASFITNVNAGPRQNMDQGFDEFFARVQYFWAKDMGADRTVPIEDVLAWFEKHRDRPAFVYIHTCEPHAPYTPPEGFAGHFDPDYRGKITGAQDSRTGFFAARNPYDIAHVAALYDEECYYADARLGQFLDTLAAAGFRERVNLFVIADHGEELQDHGHWGHGPSLYNEVLRVPLVATGPLITSRGRRDIPANLYDIMPTILDMFDIPEPYELAGTSLYPLMRSERDVADRDVAATELTPDRTTITSHHRHVAQGHIEYAVIEAANWKLLYRYMREDEPTYPLPARFELYELESDPDERRDLIHQQPDVARRLMCKLVAYAREQHPYHTSLNANQLGFDPRQLRELQSLGYIDADDE